MPARWWGHVGDGWLWRDRRGSAFTRGCQGRGKATAWIRPCAIPRAPGQVPTLAWMWGAGCPHPGGHHEVVGGSRPAWGEQTPMGAPRQGLRPALALRRDELPTGGQTGDSGALRAATTAAPGGTSLLRGAPEPAVLWHHWGGGSCAGAHQRGCHRLVRHVSGGPGPARLHHLLPLPGATGDGHRPSARVSAASLCRGGGGEAGRS